MAKRERLKPRPQSYFTSDKDELTFISSGCTLLDCALGGGWCLGRMGNVVGDKSTAKTALATEALINFKIKFPNGMAAYRDIEGAFDLPYAQAMGLPIDDVDFGGEKIDTVEDLARDLEKFVDAATKRDDFGIYVVDSWDALSDKAEMEREVGEATYGMAKAKQSSEMFRKLVRKIERSKVLVLIISQVRDNIGAMFGEKHKRSGGKALDFYASQVLWLAHIQILSRTVKSVKRAYGIKIRGKVKKNKVGLPLREADFDFIFGFGIDDVTAGVEWLKAVKRLDTIDLTENESKKYLEELDKVSDTEYAAERENVSKAVRVVWNEVEESFLPTRKKYG